MRRSEPAYVEIRSDDARTGLKSGDPAAAMPYSVSIPKTLGMATRATLQVLTGVHALDLPAVAVVAEQRADVDDPLALLARDPRPVVGVRGVRQVLVLLELVADRGEEVLGLDALLTRSSRNRLIASFFARRTMFSIMAPELKSLKYRISLSPDAYVTSRKRLRSVGSYICSIVFSIMREHACCDVAAVPLDLVGVDRHDRVQVLGHDVLGLVARRAARS